MSDEDTRWRSIASSVFVDEILLKYNGEARTDNFFSKMSSQTLAERITALKEHVFSNPNSQSGNSDQTNCDGESKIDLSNNTDPPLRQSVLTNADSKHNQSGLIVDLGKFAQTRDNSEYAEPDNRVANTNNNGETHEPTREDTFCSSSNLALDGTSRPREGIYYNDGRAIDQQALNCGDKLDNIEDGHCCGSREQINCFPVVVITPAMTEETLDECLDTTSNCKNGALSAAMFSLKDATETCSLSSAGSCSESEILTDEEASDDEIKQPLEDRSEKVDSRWKKIRSMIHWSPFVQNFKKKYPWVQLAGHQGSFKPGENGMILKKATDKERESLRKLMKDILRPYIPEYKGEVHKGNECYLEMQDLLQDFDSPSVMDCKMGTRTYLEDELAKAKSKPRKDLFQKMVEVDPNEPTEEERREGGITKPRYMRWREQLSSSASLGFRIEGIKQGDQKPNKDFKKTKTKEDVNKVFTEFIGSDDKIRRKYLRRLKAIRATLESSPFFRSHEVVGSSLLFVHDAFGKASVWMIDFGKTVPLPDGMWLDHRKPWQEGNHEDGYLWGLDNMVEIWAQS